MAHFSPVKFLLKDGRAATLRCPTEADGRQYLELCKALAEETPFMLWEPEELKDFKAADEAAFIQASNKSNSVQMIVCEVDGVIAGESRIVWNGRKRIRHRGEIMFGIRQAFWGQGMAKAMFDAIVTFAKSQGITQLELEVCEDNHRAIGFYRKLGFRETGTIPTAHRRADGSCHDILMMIRPI